MQQNVEEKKLLWHTYLNFQAKNIDILHFNLSSIEFSYHISQREEIIGFQKKILQEKLKEENNRCSKQVEKIGELKSIRKRAFWVTVIGKYCVLGISNINH